MASDNLHHLTRCLRNLVAGTHTRDASDRELMEQFVAARDDTALVPAAKVRARSSRGGNQTRCRCG